MLTYYDNNPRNLSANIKQLGIFQHSLLNIAYKVQLSELFIYLCVSLIMQTLAVYFLAYFPHHIGPKITLSHKICRTSQACPQPKRQRYANPMRARDPQPEFHLLRRFDHISLNNGPIFKI